MQVNFSLAALIASYRGTNHFVLKASIGLHCKTHLYSLIFICLMPIVCLSMMCICWLSCLQTTQQVMKAKISFHGPLPILVTPAATKLMFHEGFLVKRFDSLQFIYAMGNTALQSASECNKLDVLSVKNEREIFKQKYRFSLVIIAATYFQPIQINVILNKEIIGELNCSSDLFLNLWFC